LDFSSLRKGISLTIAEEREKRLAAKQRGGYNGKYTGEYKLRNFI
jgi:hypothetical protein